jgi:hypothetical protein
VLLVYVEKSPRILCIRSIPNCPQPRSRPEEEEEEEEEEEALGTFAFTTYSLTNSHLHGEAPRRGQPIGCLPGNTGGQISRLPHALPSSLSCLVSSRTDVAPHYSVPPSPYASLTSHSPTTAAIFIRITTPNFIKHTTKSFTS